MPLENSNCTFCGTCVHPKKSYRPFVGSAVWVAHWSWGRLMAKSWKRILPTKMKRPISHPYVSAAISPTIF
jgi:hypothetical protein